MNRFLVLLTLLCCQFLVEGQEALSSYEIVGDSIVFQFNIDAIDEILEDENVILHDFEGTDFKSLITSGEFGKWVENGWKIYQKSGIVYQLRKCLDDFKAFDWTHKYLVPSDNWKFPRSEIFDDEDNTVQDDIRIAEVSENGNVKFEIAGCESADKVILTGSFNKWDEHQIEMKKGDKSWTINMQLSPGIYEYKFIVDGVWYHDFTNNLSLKNEHETLNSILLVGKEHRFYLEGHLEEKEVILAGSFNNWDEEAMPLVKSEDGWYLTIPLPPGKHYYKFKLKKEWILDPGNKLQQGDDEGNVNSVLVIN